MKILAYDRPTHHRIEGPDWTIGISRYASAKTAIWDDVDPTEADFIMTPFVFKAHIPRVDPDRRFVGGDIMLPLIVATDETGVYESAGELRERVVRAFLGTLPWYERHPEKHIFIDNGDVDRPCTILRDSMLFKTDPNYRDADVMAIPRPVHDPGAPIPIVEATIDISFQGLVSQHPIRERLQSWCKHQTEVRVEFNATETSFYRTHHDDRPALVEDSSALMRRSKFVLAPRGKGTTSRRFFEILAHGRIPILVSDAAKLPLESTIDYKRFVVRVPEGFVGQTGKYIRQFELEHDIMAASELARSTYLEYFAPESFRHFVEVSLSTQSRYSNAIA